MKQKIFKATLELIGTNGIHNAPLSEIAKMANISVGSVYNYFGSKEELIDALYLELKKELMDFLMENQNSTLSYRDRFSLVWLSMFKYFSKNPLSFNFISQLESSPFLKREIANLSRKENSFISSFLNEGVEGNYVVDLPVELIENLLNHSVAAVTRVFFEDREKLDNNTLNQCLNFCWKGFSKYE